MSVIKTQRNFVCAYDALPQDTFIETYLTGTEGRRLLSTQTIDNYQAAVDWAVSIADQMAQPIEVVTITAAEFMRKNHERLERGLAAMTDQERGALRWHVVKAVSEVLVKCDDAEVRAEAHAVLVNLGVVR